MKKIKEEILRKQIEQSIESDAWKDSLVDREANNEKILADLYNRFNRAAEQAMPQLAM